MKIYHNPRCSKSRQGLSFLEELNQSFEVIEYLKTPITFDELSEIITLLKIAPIELVRKNEQLWKDNFKGKQLSDPEIIQAMIDNPKLIERPIVVHNSKAVIGRPTDLINTVL